MPPTGFNRDWAAAKLNSLRRRLEVQAEWPETADRLWPDLALSDEQEVDFEMLNIVVNEALEGVDIASRYPAFYRKILTHPQLRQAFLDALDILEKDGEGELQSLPHTEGRNMSFLEEDAAPQISRRADSAYAGVGAGWRVSWRVGRGRLQEQLFTSFSGVYRSADDFLENPIITLIRGQAEVDALQLEMLLEAVQSDDASSLSLLLWLGADEPLPPMRATFHWGGYEESLIVESDGQATFPPLPLAAILDETGRQLTGDLTLTLEPAAPS